MKELNLMKEQKQPPVVILEQTILYSIFILCLYLRIRSGCLVHEFSFTYIFNNINHIYRAPILKKYSLWLLPFYMAWLLISIMKRCAERSALQLYQTSLKFGLFDNNLLPHLK